MEWEQKFSSIVKETESNLARVRERLASSQSNNINSRNPYNEMQRLASSSHLSKSMDSLRSRPAFFPKRSSISPTIHTQDSYKSPPPLSARRESSALVNVLLERLEQQSEMVDSLSGRVKRLEKDKSSHVATISALQEQVFELNKRLREQGVDMETERKLEQLKREVFSELNTIQRRDRRQSSGDSDTSTSSLARELYESKRLLQDDCDSVRREIDHLKTRIGKIELELQASLGDERDTMRRIERLDRTITVLSENQRSQSHSLSSMVDERNMRTADVRDLRGTVEDLSRQLSDLDTNSKSVHRKRYQLSPTGSTRDKGYKSRSKSSSSKGVLNGVEPASRKGKNKHKSFDLSLSDSDVDISTTALDLSGTSDSDLSSVQLTTMPASNPARANGELLELSSTSLSSLDSDDLLDVDLLSH